MKKVFIFAIVFIFSSLAFAQKGFLRITSNMSDVGIYMGEKQVAMLGDGKTDMKLKSGKYTITLIKPIDEEHEYRAIREVFIGADTVTRVHFKLKRAFTKKSKARQDKEEADFISKNGTVYDKRLKLTWQDSSAAKSIKKKWKGAKSYCENLNFAGFSDWRLPSVEELLSITDMDRFSLATRKAFKNIDFTQNYWSSSSVANKKAPHYAWVVNFRDGNCQLGSKKNLLLVRCVR